MQEWLIQIGTNYHYLFYLIIIVIAYFEGPILAMICGVLLSIGYFSLIPIYITLVIADLLGDITWYFLGYKWGRSVITKFGKYFSLTDDNIMLAESLFHRYKYKILFISKLTNGFGLIIPILITAGITKVNFKNYLFVNAIGELIWSAFLLGIGYYFGNLYLSIDSFIWKLTIISLFIIICIAIVGYGKYMYKQAKENKLI